MVLHEEQQQRRNPQHPEPDQGRHPFRGCPPVLVVDHRGRDGVDSQRPLIRVCEFVECIPGEAPRRRAHPRRPRPGAYAVLNPEPYMMLP